MRRILSSQEKRRLRLIEELSQANRWVSFDELSEMLDSSERTIREDIDALNNKHDFFNTEPSNNGIHYQHQPNQNIQSIYLHLITNSVGFRFIAELFEHGEVTIEDMINKLYLSRSSIYRLVPAISEALEDNYNISISNSPFRFVGDEKDIRWFLSQYLSERHIYFNEPEQPLEERLVEILVEQFCDITGFKVNYSGVRLVKIAVIINSKRIKQGFYNDTMKVRQDVVDNIIYGQPTIKKTVQDLFDTLELEFNPRNIADIFGSFIQEGFYYSTEEMLNALPANPFLKQAYINLHILISSLITEYDLTIANKDDLIYEMYLTTVLHKFEVDSNYIFYNQKQIFAKDVQRLFPLFYDDCNASLSDYLAAVNFEADPIILNQLFYKLFTHWPGLQSSIYRKNHLIKGLVISTFDMSHGIMLAKQLNLEIGMRAEFDVFDKLTVDYDALAASDYDIVVANHPLPNIPNKKTVTVRTAPTTKDIIKIYQIIYAIIVERREKL